MNVYFAVPIIPRTTFSNQRALLAQAGAVAGALVMAARAHVGARRRVLH